jgi:hypothetical protein
MEILFHNFGQGRIETFYRSSYTAKVLYEVDGTWMYAACSRDVPTRECVHDEGNELLHEGKSPAFYRVVALVPSDWHHVGLLPAYGSPAFLIPLANSSLLPQAAFWSVYGVARSGCARARYSIHRPCEQPQAARKPVRQQYQDCVRPTKQNDLHPVETSDDIQTSQVRRTHQDGRNKYT